MLNSLQKLVSFVAIMITDTSLILENVVSAILNIMSMYHDTLLAKVARTDPKYKPLLPASPHTRYTRAWCAKDARYKWAARALELIRFTELLLEMGLRRKVSRQTRWRGVVLLEVIKCVSCRGHAVNQPNSLSEHSFVSPCCVSPDVPWSLLPSPSVNSIQRTSRRARSHPHPLWRLLRHHHQFRPRRSI